MKQISDFFSHIFTPQEKNNYRAKALHPDALTYYLVFAIFLTFFVRFINGNFSNVLGFATDVSVTRLLELTNEKRTGNGLPPLQYNEKLSVAAQKKAEDMFAKGYWAHFAPDGITPWSFILSSGYQYEYAGENLAKNFLFSQGVVDAWMNSPTHKENILRNDYTDVGFAVVNGVLNGEETTLVVQMFGKPLNYVALTPLTEPVSAETRTVSEDDTEIIITPVKEAIEPTIEIPAYQPDRQTISSPVILSGQTKPKVNLLPVFFTSNLLFFGFLLIVLGLDFYYAARMNIIRIGGKHIAHFIFIGFIIAGLLMTLIKGSIL